MKYRVDATMSFDSDRNIVIINGVSYSIDGNETRLLEYLIINKNKVCSYDSILTHLYGENGNGYDKGTIRTYISRIKAKTNNVLNQYILTHTGKGYEFSTLNNFTKQSYSINHVCIDNDYFVGLDTITFVKFFTSKVTTKDDRAINYIHFRATWFADEDVDVIPITSNIQSVDEILFPDSNRNYNIVFKEPISKDQIVQYAIKIICTNKHKHFQNFFSTQVIVPIENLHIHLYLDKSFGISHYYTQVLSDSLHNQLTENPVKHEYIYPVHWHIERPKLHLEYKIYW